MKTKSMRLAVITGASSGIGAVYAHRLARHGYDLLLVARSREPMEDLAKRLAAGTRHKAEVLAADLTDSNDLAGAERILRAARYATVRAVRRGVYV
jgi:short-subunit dehydrogenase